MKRECIWTGVGSEKQIEDVYEHFEQGWILDPWLHGTNRPWTVPTTASVVLQGGVGSGSRALQSQTILVWNLILLEEGDDPTDPEWILKNCPVGKITVPKYEVAPLVKDPIVDEALITYDEVSHYAARGYEVPEDKSWAKNRLVRLRASVIKDMAGRQGLTPLVREVLELVPTNELWDYLKAKAEAQVEHEANMGQGEIDAEELDKYNADLQADRDRDEEAKQ